MMFSQQWNMTADLRYEHWRYKDVDTNLGRRMDNFVTFDLNIRRKIKPDLYVEFVAQHRQNRSNVNVYTYRKNRVQCNVVKHF